MNVTAGMQFVIGHDHPALPGHFPGQPVVPGVVVLERVLEAIERQAGPLPALAIPQAKFLRPLLPGEQARVVLEPLPGARWRFRVLHGERLVASGEAAAGDAPA